MSFTSIYTNDMKLSYIKDNCIGEKHVTWFTPCDFSHVVTFDSGVHVVTYWYHWIPQKIALYSYNDSLSEQQEEGFQAFKGQFN